MMKAQYKLVLGLLPFVASGIFCSASVYPAYLEDIAKHDEVATKQKENNVLLSRLSERGSAEIERRKLETQITELRSSVPKSPELDLFILDLEKMCHQSGVDLIGVENPDPEVLKALDSSEEEMRKIGEDSGGKLTGSKSLEKKGQKGDAP